MKGGLRAMTKENLLHITIILISIQNLTNSVGYVVGNNVAMLILRTISLALGFASIVTLCASTRK